MTDAANPNIDEVNVRAYINYGPSFEELKVDNFYREDNMLGHPLMMELHSSINSMYRYGSITFEDNVGLRERFPLSGNEIITVLYRNSSSVGLEGQSPRDKMIHFNIFDIQEEQARSDGAKEERFQRKYLKFHIIECPFYLLYNSSNISRTFGKDYGDGRIVAPKINEIFEDVIKNQLGLNEEFFDLDMHEMAKDTFRVSCPFWKPQKFFKYLLGFARDKDDSGNVKFFTTTDLETGIVKINLKSMLGMFKKPRPTGMHPYTLVDVAPFSQDVKLPSKSLPKGTLNQIFNYKFLTYDLSSITTGLAGGTYLNYDYNGSVGYHEVRDNYVLSNSRNKYISNFGLWSNQISNSDSQLHYIGKLPPTVARNYLNNRLIEDKFQIRCEALTMINERVECGDIIVVMFMTAVPIFEGQEQIIDEQMSGGWLVEDMVDIVTNGRGFRKYVLVKDSYFNLTTPPGVDTSERLPPVDSIMANVGSTTNPDPGNEAVNESEDLNDLTKLATQPNV